jgi:hypothetical protein
MGYCHFTKHRGLQDKYNIDLLMLNINIFYEAETLRERRALYMLIDKCMPLSISGLLSSQKTDIDSRALARVSMSVEG